MSKRIHLIGIIAVIIYFLSVGSFLISQTDIALTIWELMTVISGPIVLLVLLELSHRFSSPDLNRRALQVFMGCTCALTGAAHIVNITVTRRLIASADKTVKSMKVISLIDGILCLIGFVGALFINGNIWYLAPMGYGFGLLILCIMRLHKE